MKKIGFILLFFTFLTLTSALPLTQLADNSLNQNSQQVKKSSDTNPVTQNSKIQSIVSPKTAYTYSEKFNVSDVVNKTYYYTNLKGQSASTWSDVRWFIPTQQVDVYLGKDPCPSRDSNDVCQMPSNIGQYKLTVTAGNAQSGGIDNPANPGLDYVYGVWNGPTTSSPSPETLQTYTNWLSYNFQVQIPDQITLTGLGITGGQVSLYEFYPGNTTVTPYKVGWIIKNTTITLSSDSSVSVTTPTPTNTISAPQNTSTIVFQVSNAGIPMGDTQIIYNITSNSNSSMVCGPNLPVSCNTYGFNVTEVGNGTNNDLTFSNGYIYYNVTFLSLGSIFEGGYNFSITAFLIHPTDSDAKDYALSPYYLTKNKTAAVNLDVNYNLQTPQITQEIVPGFSTNTFPFSTSNHQLRPGDYIEGYIKQTVFSGSMPVQGVSLVAQLYDAGNNYNYTPQLISGQIAKLTYLVGPTSDSNGSIWFNLSLSYSAPLTSYNLVLFGNYVSITNTSPYWIKTPMIQLLSNYSFTVSNLYDQGSIQYISATPSRNVSLSTNPSTLTISFLAQASLNGTYKAYASQYSPNPLPSDPYPLIGLPVNATITGGPINGITLSVSSFFNKYNTTFYYTNSTGYIDFVLKTKYPDIYDLTTFNLTVVANYTPMIQSNLQSYRFTRDSSIANISSTKSLSVSFNPYYTVVDVIPVSSNVTGGTLRPGDTGLFVYKTVNTADKSIIGSVPFNFSLILGQSTPGVKLYTNNSPNIYDTNYYSSDPTTGKIFIFFRSIYGTTNETITPINFTINVYLNITLFNNTNPIHTNFYIGTQHINKLTFNNFVTTWSNYDQTNFTVMADYQFGKGIWVDPITDTQILDPTAGLNLIRPNNETITIRLRIVDNSTLANLLNYQFPVKVTVLTSYPGITISNTTPQFSPGWYYSNNLGYIDFNVYIYYIPGYSKSAIVRFNATIDFGNGVNGTGGSADYVKWIVGEYGVSGQNLSQSSFSWTNNAQLLNLTIAPAYVTGKVEFVSAIPSITVPNNIVNLTYKVYIPKTDTYAIKDSLITGGNDLYVQGVKVYLNETILTMYNMNVTNNGQISGVDGQVSFNVGILNTALENFYQIPAYADFENDQGMSISPTSKTGTFNYYWLNGTSSTLGYLNASHTLTIQNYSQGNSTSIQVVYARTTTVTVTRVFDKTGALTSIKSPSTIEALRGYTIELSILYADQFNTPLAFYPLNGIIQVTNPSGAKQNYTLTNIGSTDVNGYLNYNLTIQNNYYVGNVVFYAIDPNVASIFIPNPMDMIIKSELSFVNVAYVLPVGSNEVYVGENISISGYLQDELGQMGTNYYSGGVLSELLNNLQISGYNSLNALISGTTLYKNFTIGPSSVTFSLNWNVPSTYLDSGLSIHINVNDSGIAHFVTSTSLIPGSLPSNVSSFIPTYQSVKYVFNLSDTDATNTNKTGFTFYINNDFTGQVNLTGRLYDNHDRPLVNRNIYSYWNSTLNTKTALSDQNGNFSIQNLIPQLNQNVSYILTIYYLTYNSIQINITSNTLLRIVHDTYAPTITLLTNITTYYVYQDTSLTYNLTDPTYVNNGQDYVPATGINKTSVVLLQNGVPIWDNSLGNKWNGLSLLTIQWNYTTIASSYNLTLIVRDNANIESSYSIILLIDNIKPDILSTNPNHSIYVYQSNFVFNFTATDNGQTGLDNTSAKVNIDGSDYTMTYNITTNTFISNSFNFSHSLVDRQVYFIISDLAGNTQTTSNNPITLLADTIKPSISLMPPYTNNFEEPNKTVTFAFNMTDTQTGVNLTTINLYSGNGNTLIETSNSLNITSQGSYYIVTGQIAHNYLDLTKSQQSFFVNVSDNNGNTNDFNLLFKIDIEGPSISAEGAFQPNVTSSDLINTKDKNATASLQYISFNFTDSGTPTTGVDASYLEIVLSVNATRNITLVVTFGALSVSDQALSSDFKVFNFDSNGITLSWNASNMEAYGITKIHKQQQITITWTIITLRDKFGNNIATNTDKTLPYYMDIEALPPPPDYIGMILNLLFTFGLFIVVGIGAAYIFEKIRYVG